MIKRTLPYLLLNIRYSLGYKADEAVIYADRIIDQEVWWLDSETIKQIDLIRRDYPQLFTNGHFNWWKALDLMEHNIMIRRYPFEILARNWVTCACGNLCSNIKRATNGVPIDDILSTLGKDFSYCVKNRKFKSAKLVLRLIELRASTLLK